MEEEEGFEEEPTTDATDTAGEGDTTDVTDTEDETSKALQPSDKKSSALAELMVEDLEITDSQVMIQLKEAEDEAESVRREVAIIKAEIERYQDQEELGQEDAVVLQDKQLVLMDKLAYLEQLTKKIERLMRLSPKGRPSEEPTILDEDSEEEEEGFPDDLLPRVVICSSWDDMMPKVVVCMDMKKPGAAKKLEGERDENGLTPEQREALEQERRCMAEERNRLQYQIACLEGEMRVMMRENDMLSRKIAQLKADAENQPPFEFEMSVSATNPPGIGPPKSGDMDMGFGVMGPGHGGTYHMGAALAPGAEVQARMVMPQQFQIPVGDHRCPCSNRNALPCGGPSEIPGKSMPCPSMAEQYPQQQLPPVPSLPPFGKRCRKEFNECPCSGGMMTDPSQLVPKQPPMDLNFKVNVQPQSRQNEKERDGDPVTRSNRVAQQLQEIEMEVRRMQRELQRAKKDKETLRAQQATLQCAKTSLM